MNLNTDPSRPSGNIPFSRPEIGPEEEQAVLRVLRSGWLTTGPETRAFEEEFAKVVDMPHALAVNSATAGLHLALEALGVQAGDWVALPTLTFTATGETARYLGAQLLLIDVDPRTLNMDLADLERRLQLRMDQGHNPPVKAVVAVHFAGRSCKMEALLDLSRRYGFHVVEDAAHSFPGSHKGRYQGTWGDVGVFSFYANKNMTTGEGGMVVCRDPQLARRMSVMRLHGLDRDAFDRFSRPQAPWEYDVIAPGFKYNLTDIASALGRVQLRRAGDFLEKRQGLVHLYRQELEGQGPWDLPPEDSEHSWHLMLLVLHVPPGEDLPGSLRAWTIRELAQRGIGTSVHYKPLHRMSWYREACRVHNSDFPGAEYLWPGLLSLPLYPSLERQQVLRVCQELKQLLASVDQGVIHVP